jgi:squalene-associated FAD-dependent desaturase
MAHLVRSVTTRGAKTHAAKTHNIAVIGGGWAGMAAALELTAHGIPVTVFEAAKTLGGRARRVEMDGVALDNGLHILIGAYRETLRVIEQVSVAGQAPKLLRLPLQLRLEPGFRMRAAHLPGPLHVAIALAFARGLPITEKLAALRFMRAQKSNGFQCEPGLTVSALLESFRQPANLMSCLWLPLCVSALNTSPEQADAQVFLNVLQDSLAGPRSASDLLLPKTDFSNLFPDPAADHVERFGGQVLRGAAVTSLRMLDHGFEVSAASTTRHTHVVLAVGPHRLEQVASEIDQLAPQVAMVRRFTYQPIFSVFLQYPQSVGLPVPMTGMKQGLAQWIFDRGQLCGQPGMLGVVISASGVHQDLPQSELARRVHQELQHRFALPEPRWSRVIAEKRATFACTPGLQRPATRTSIPGLYIAGDYTQSRFPATLETAVRSGLDCARQILVDHV